VNVTIRRRPPRPGHRRSRPARTLEGAHPPARAEARWLDHPSVGLGAHHQALRRTALQASSAGVWHGGQRSGTACATGPAWPARRVSSEHLTLVLPLTWGPGMPLSDLLPRLPPPSVVCLTRAGTCGRPPASAVYVLVQALRMVTAQTAGEGGKWKIIVLTLQSEYNTIHSLSRESSPRVGRTETRWPARSRCDPRLYGLGDRRPRGASHVCVSCVNRWRPWGQAHPDMMQGTGDVHHEIMDALHPQADPVVHDAPAQHTYDGGDGLHPSDRGYGQRGDAIDRALCDEAPLPGGSLTTRLQGA
jgi:hypothetical protein